MSKLVYVEGDLFAALDSLKIEDSVIVPHVCNSVGAWGSGFVVPLGKKYPQVPTAYHGWHKNGDSRPQGFMDVLNPKQIPFQIGQTQFVIGSNDPEIVIANMIAQHMGGDRPLRYNHLAACMDCVAQLANSLKSSIICPLFGAGLAGGNWDFISELIEDCWLDKNIDVKVFYIPGKTPHGWTPPQIKLPQT